MADCPVRGGRCLADQKKTVGCRSNLELVLQNQAAVFATVQLFKEDAGIHRV